MAEKIYAVPNRIANPPLVVAVFKREHELHPYVVGIPTGSDVEGEQWRWGDYFPTENEAVLWMFRRALWDVCKTPLKQGANHG